MANRSDLPNAFRSCFLGGGATADFDYTLLEELGGTYAAISRQGAPTLVIPLTEAPQGAAGRITTGFELIAHSSIKLAHDGRTWDSPAAALVCHDRELLDAFAVLATDVVDKTDHERTWAKVTAVVEEWMSLLAPRGRPSAELEAGLWGELWFIAQCDEPTRVLAGWCGPDGDSTDFFVDGMAVEIKVSRQRHKHFVSQSQVDLPVGELPAWLMSIWVKSGPTEGIRSTIPALVDEILRRVPEKGDALRRIARAGYSPSDRKAYATAFSVLEEPSWFASSTVPRVRLADPGVSRLRYEVTLDEALRADGATAMRLWSHFRAK